MPSTLGDNFTIIIEGGDGGHAAAVASGFADDAAASAALAEGFADAAADILADLGDAPDDGFGTAFRRIEGISANFDIELQRNLYDPALAEDGKLYNYLGGSEAAFANSIITGMMPVEAGKHYVLWQKSPEKGFFPYLYAWGPTGTYLGMNAAPSGSGATVVAGFNLVTSDAGGTGGYRVLSFDVPAGVGFIGTMALYVYSSHTTDDFNRIRLATQLEEGAAKTAFHDYTGLDAYALPADVARTADTGPIVEAFTIEPQRNLYDASNAVDGQITGYNTGANSGYANGMAFGRFPVEEGKSYVLWMSDPLGFAPNGNKPLYCYDTVGVFLGLDAAIGANPAAPTPPTGVVWTGITQVTFTIPIGSGIAFIGSMATYSSHTTDDFNRAVGTIQAEEGTTPTAYQPYSEYGFATLPADRITGLSDNEALAVVRYNDALYVRASFSDTQDIIQRINLTNAAAAAAFTGNDVVNHQGARLAAKATADTVAAWSAGTIYHATGDDAAPLNYNGTYIGANHGPYIAREVTAAGHGKTVADVGAEYQDGAAVSWFIMRIVDANKLWVVSENSKTYPDWAGGFTLAITGNLTHVSGGTNTSGITVSSSTGAQLYPCVKGRAVSVYLNGTTKITADGTYSCATVDIAEIYKITNPASVLEHVKASVGGATQPDFLHADVEEDVERSILYRFAENGSCSIVDAPLALNPLTMGFYGGTQAGALTYTGKELWQYIPRVNAKVGTVKTWNFKTAERIDGTFEELHLLSADWEDVNNPPDRMAQLVKSAGAYQFGLMVGYSPVRGVGVKAFRKTLVNDALFLSAIRKQYPKAVNIGPIDAGDFFEITAFRSYFNPAENSSATAVAWYRDGKNVIVMLDCHAAVSNLAINLPPYLAGMDWEVVDKTASVTILGNGIVSTGGLRATCSTTYGYAVLKLS